MSTIKLFEEFILEEEHNIYYFSYVDHAESRIVGNSVRLFARLAGNHLRSLESNPKRFKMISMTTDSDEHESNIKDLRSKMKNQFKVYIDGERSTEY